ncbi:response regulator [Paenibacillus doosanensis]|uniref:response regulator n=1 Tax=Paenibacillus doosanensis TaxID=1229154 RepID=UPI0021807E9E|nr:response regulator [Paenibacillus doosanensis]MCS7464791.1 response regulator [Paenibacillus doosanensis]
MTVKVMLVDDEILVRLGIKSLIDWERHGFSYVGDAPDGKKALEAMEETVPDILLTDIIMPQMNGLELIEEVRKRFPHTRIIVLSSHDEYEYVRKAMKLGVDDYILKASMKPDELLELLRETALKIEAGYAGVRQKLAGNKAQEGQESGAEWLKKLLDRTDSDPAAGVETSGEWKAGTAADISVPATLGNGNFILVLHIHLPPAAAFDDASSIPTLMNLVQLEMDQWLLACPVHYREREIVALITPPEHSSGIDAQAACQGLISAAKRFLGISLSAGVSLTFREPGELRAAYKQALQAVSLYYYEGKEKTYVYTSGLERSHGAASLSQDDERSLMRALQSMDEERLRETIHGLFDRLQEERMTKENSIQYGLQMLHIIQTAWKPFGEDGFEGLEGPLYRQVLGFEELEEARRWFIRLVEAGLERIRRTHREPYHDEIRKLIQYMKEHYMQDLSLKQAAEMVNMNESYLSYLFKKETQTGFTEYLNRLRLDKAAQYLAETSLPSYLIAEKVGYANINYFGRIFKKITGLSPQQYRSKCQNQNK